MIYEIIDNFDVWGNKKEGYFVNNAINTHIQIDIKEYMTDRRIIQWLNKIL